jgi:hypothetical protein
MSGELLSREHQQSGRTAIIADEGDSVWLYLTEPHATAIAADCWLFNRIVAPSAAALQARLGEYRAQALPPPAPADTVGPRGLRELPLEPDSVALTWSATGDAVAAWVEGELVGFIGPGDRRGHSRHLLAEGPWGAPLDLGLFLHLFPSEPG